MFRKLIGNQLHQFPVDDFVSLRIEMKSVMQHVRKCLVLLNLTRPGQWIALFPTGFLHERGPDVEYRETELLTKLTDCLCVLGCVGGGASHDVNAIGLVVRKCLSLLNWRWSKQDELRLMCLERGMVDDICQVALVLLEIDSLRESGSIGKSSIIGSQEDGLQISLSCHSPIGWRETDH